MSLRTRALTVAYATANFTLLALPALAGAAEKKSAPPLSGTYGEDKPLDLPSGAPPQLGDAGASGGGSLVRTFVGLAVVVAVIYGLYWVLRQVKSSREERAVGGGLASQAVVPLGPGRSLHLVRAGRELVLVGVAEHGVTPIRRYTEAEAEELGLVGDRDGGGAGDGPLAPLPEPGRRRHPSGAMTIGDLLDRVRLWTVRK
ncbi:MAG TPA: flagellar biosynthetic protein FliO [Solirubrobacteraceae bacterium]|jgi:flagellar protein FliO/FliZ|nr:flagellar biosynthetic protein FliO [Solirubrobacteraceae bacterium]